MNVESIEENSLEFLKEKISNLGGWPVVEEDRWFGDNFTWWNISIAQWAEALVRAHFRAPNIMCFF